MIPDITTPRLILRHLTAELLQWSLQDRLDDLGRALQARLPAEWGEDKAHFEMRINDYADNPAYLPWGPRAAILKETGEVVARAGYHTAPGPDYLTPYALGGIEFGYSVFPAFRRKGYASEIARALIAHAAAQGVPRFALSVSPDNAASLAIVKKLGFARVGEHMDPEDGLEWIFAREASAPIDASGGLD